MGNAVFGGALVPGRLVELGGSLLLQAIKPQSTMTGRTIRAFGILKILLLAFGRL
jgi:hypothetical protein